ncbi:Cof-type HAD-IIB family hydrolase [Clostridium sp.]|uniref:Cof-type HAD-IIB family hydrolase n=1 Tax=Clostridium sp. TaxID=1506 RepID=UPI00262ACB42|nr:Cof-type HAD-IIB family hydrolase [Clostridium sp.]
MKTEFHDFFKNKKISQFKLLAIDMDGTTLNGKHELSDRTVNAIQKVYNKGLRVLFATGRMSSAVEKHLRILGTDGLVVSHNGALVLDIYKNHIYLHNRVNRKVVDEVMQFYDNYNSVLHFNIGDKVIVEKINKLSERYSKELGIKLDIINSFSDISENPTSLLLIDNKSKLKNFLNYICSKYAGLFDYEFIPWTEDTWMLQFLYPNTSKGGAVINLAKQEKIDNHEIISFGDSYNDMEMIRQCGLGIAMGNACEELKKDADFVTKTNDQDGVAYVLEQLLSNA